MQDLRPLCPLGRPGRNSAPFRRKSSLSLFLYAMSDCNEYRTIRSLVLDYVHRNQGVVVYEALTAEVLKRFPWSQWKKTHWSWYRYQILRGRFREMFSEEERKALSEGTAPTGKPSQPEPRPKSTESLSKGPEAREPEIKRIGDAILQGGVGPVKTFSFRQLSFDSVHCPLISPANRDCPGALTSYPTVGGPSWHEPEFMVFARPHFGALHLHSGRWPVAGLCLDAIYKDWVSAGVPNIHADRNCVSPATPPFF